ncbi:MAG: ABC transporter ATP-binding protein [Erysipelotrichaceae bacterium]|nr:ABC transporter ATP-binding protein [Erysipelotrichaceae bacterium]
MKDLAAYLKKYKKEAFLAPFFKLLEALMDLIVPLVVADIINKGLFLKDRSIIYRDFVFLIVLAVAGMLFSFTAQFFAAKAAVGCSSDLRQSLFEKIGTFSYAQYDDLTIGTLITRMTADINQIQTGLNLALRLLLRSPFIVFGSLIMAFTIDVRLALIFAVVIPLLCLAVYAIMLKSIPLFEKAQKAMDKLLSFLREDLNGVRVIRAFNKEKSEIEGFDERSDLLTALNLKVGRLSALMNPLTYVLINTATIVLIYQGAIRIDGGLLLQGDLVALYNYMAQIIVELIKLASLTITINKSMACAKRVSEILKIEADMKYPAKDPKEEDEESAVSFDHVFFRYGKQSDDVLSDISFEVKKGESTGIIGATGSGKSSLVSLIPRFYDADKGVVRVNGNDVRSYSKEKLSELIAVVPQKAVLFAGSIRDNLCMGKDYSEEKIWQALSIAQASDVVRGKEGGLDSFIEQGGRNLSGGQRQRLTIARAVLKDPSILILDDSASALDFATDLHLRQALNRLPMSVFIVSQRASSIRHCDQIIVLDDGKIVGKGRHEELLENCDVYQEIYHSQFAKEDEEDEA